MGPGSCSGRAIILKVIARSAHSAGIFGHLFSPKVRLPFHASAVACADVFEWRKTQGVKPTDETNFLGASRVSIVPHLVSYHCLARKRYFCCGRLKGIEAHLVEGFPLGHSEKKRIQRRVTLYITYRAALFQRKNVYLPASLL